ncbi:replicative DNA helicase [Sodalis sp. C49]|uniref:replicative DNA helicase n=1 Tax=Sodalis sp. C49 TaxID=3228929 RepID=UPI003965A79D
MTPQELEGAVIGGLLKSGASPDALDVLATLPDEAFSIGFYRTAYREIKKQALSLGVIDGLLISEALGGDSLSKFTEAMRQPTVESNLKGYAKLTGKSWFTRKAIVLFQGTADAIREARNQQQRDQAIEGALANLVELTTDSGDIIPVHIQDLLPSYMDLIDKRMTGDASITNLMTGIPELDAMLGGINRQDLVVLAGRPGMGKTEFLLSMVEGATRNGGGALIFSMEMAAMQLVERSIAGAGNLPVAKLRDPGTLFDEDWARISAALGMLSDRNIWIVDATELTIDQIRAISETHKRRYPNLKMVAVDYLGLITKPKAERHDLAVGMISGGLKRLAGRIQTPVIALSQMSRKVDERPANSRRPILSDLRDSGSVEQDADRIIMLYRDGVYNPDSPAKGLAEVIIAKNRFGQLGTVYQEFKNGHFLPVDQLAAEQTTKVFQNAKQRERRYSTRAF